MSYRFDRRFAAYTAGISVFCGVAFTAGLVASASSYVAITTETMVFGATDDTYSSEAAPLRANGDSAKLAATEAVRGRKIIYLKFKVAGVPDGATDFQVALLLNRTTHHLPPTIEIRRVADTAWSESNMTYASAPAVGAVVARHSTQYKPVAQRVEIGPYVSGNGRVTFAITSPSMTDVARLDSKESGDLGPRLEISYSVPTETSAPADSTPTETSAPADSTPTETSAPADSTPTSTSAPADSTPTETSAPADSTPTSTVIGKGPYPKVASVQQKTGESWADACVRTMSYGFSGCVRYLPSGKLPAWDASFQALAAQVGDWPVSILLTAKTHDDAGLADVLTHLPAAWKAQFIYNVYQEPEDNLTDTAAQAAYRDAYRQAAAVTRSYGANLPWVEWQEWTVDPVNNRGWDLANFTPRSEDFGGVLWSLFEYGEKNRLDDQISRVTRAMDTYAPGKPWRLMAGAYTLENPPFTDAQELAQANWLKNSFQKSKAAGSLGWAWFNFDFPGTGGPAGESRVEANGYALNELKALVD